MAPITWPRLALRHDTFGHPAICCGPQAATRHCMTPSTACLPPPDPTAAITGDRSPGNEKTRLLAGSFCSVGRAKRDRTADLYNAIVALSQLSYSPVTGDPTILDLVVQPHPLGAVARTPHCLSQPLPAGQEKNVAFGPDSYSSSFGRPGRISSSSSRSSAIRPALSSFPTLMSSSSNSASSSDASDGDASSVV